MFVSSKLPSAFTAYSFTTSLLPFGAKNEEALKEGAFEATFKLSIEPVIE